MRRAYCTTPPACWAERQRRTQERDPLMKLPITNPTRTLFGSASALVAVGVLSLAACGGGSRTDSTTVTVQGDVPIAYAKRVNTIGLNPTNGAPTAPGGDLMIREKSSPSAPEHNITAQFTLGKGDA